MNNTTTSQVSTHRITAAIGVELTGLDLRRELEPDTVELIRDSVAQHHVAVIRDQFLDERQLQTVAERLGPILLSPVQRMTASSTGVSTIEDTADRPPAGFGWHTDLSWIPEPPALGFLSAVTIPPYGGDTMWASTARIYDKLSDTDRQRCDTLSLIHAPDASLLKSVGRHHGPSFAQQLEAQHPPVEHPLVRTHPTTGRRSLFLSPLYTRRLTGPPGLNSLLVQRLHASLDDPYVQLRWRWRAGDLIIWDEGSTCHRALTDHHPQHRAMRRCVTAQTSRTQP